MIDWKVVRREVQEIDEAYLTTYCTCFLPLFGSIDSCAIAGLAFLLVIAASPMACFKCESLDSCSVPTWQAILLCSSLSLSFATVLLPWLPPRRTQTDVRNHFVRHCGNSRVYIVASTGGESRKTCWSEFPKDPGQEFQDKRPIRTFKEYFLKQ